MGGWAGYEMSGVEEIQSFGEGTVLGMEDRNVLALMVAGA
jgi:hypothetical protein